MNRVIKRDGREEAIDFGKIVKRIHGQAQGLTHVNVNEVSQKVIQGVYDGVKTTELGEQLFRKKLTKKVFARFF